MQVRTIFQPTAILEVDDAEAKVLEHQGLLWNGTPVELAALCAEAGLEPASPPDKPPVTSAVVKSTDQAKGA